MFYMHKVILETNCEDGKVWIEGYFHRRTKTYKNSFFKLHDFCNIKNCVQKRKEYFALFNMLWYTKEITLPQILTILRLHCPSVSNQRSCIKIEKWVFYKSFRPWCYLDLMQSKIKEMTFCFDFAKGISRSITPSMIILFFILLIIISRWHIYL